jgi:hypothetical protein
LNRTHLVAQVRTEEAIYSRHPIERMFQRVIPPEEVTAVLRSGDAIASYPEDTPYPSVLLLGRAQNQPVHVLVARDPATGTCYVVTVYRPDPELWGPDYKTRRQP